MRVEGKLSETEARAVCPDREQRGDHREVAHVGKLDVEGLRSVEGDAGRRNQLRAKSSALSAA